MDLLDNKQESLAKSIYCEETKDVFELIQHQDRNYWVYFNGGITDVCFPRSDYFHKGLTSFEIYEKLWYGESVYNKRRIEKFFRKITPESFL